MFGQPDPKPTGSFGDHFRKLWKNLKTNKIFAYFLLTLMAIKGLPIPYVNHLYNAALWALGIIILDQLYTLIETFNLSKRRRTFKDITDAQPALVEHIKECYKRDKYVEIKWLGMTMGNAWTSLTYVLNELREEGVKNLLLKVTMLDSVWLNTNRVNKGWTPERAIATEGNISVYFGSNAAKTLEWRLALSHYAHMPCIHGGLINNKYLFLGTCQWNPSSLEAGEWCLEAGERPYYLYTFKEVDDEEKIKVFKGWFEYCTTHGPVASTGNQAEYSVPQSHWGGISDE